jgi:hypothetical protein
VETCRGKKKEETIVAIVEINTQAYKWENILHTTLEVLIDFSLITFKAIKL